MSDNEKQVLYDYVLFDADETLFDFRRAEKMAFFKVFKSYGFTLLEEDLDLYMKINEGLWRDLEEGLIEKADLKVQRFIAFFNALSQTKQKDKALMGKALMEVDPKAFSEKYLDYLSYGSCLLPQALEACTLLSKYCRLAIMTNGIFRVQEARLDRSPIKPYISHLFVSESFGVAKPQKEFFDQVFAILGIDTPAKIKRTLICGDSLTSDIAGGIGVGIHTCWFNPTGDFSKGRNLPITYCIKELSQVIDIVIGNKEQRDG